MSRPRDPSGARGSEVAGRIPHLATPFFARLEWPFYQAFGLAGAGRCDIALGERERGLGALSHARDLAFGMQARPLLAEIDSAIAAATHEATARA